MNFVDRMLRCSDCGNDFVFTAGEQLFFVDRQFKNDPKRCKLCKAKRAGLGRSVEGSATLATLPLSRTETRTECCACGTETTVPFKPTQGRPVFCRSCFQLKRAPLPSAELTPSFAEKGASSEVLLTFPSHQAAVDELAESALATLTASDAYAAGRERGTSRHASRLHAAETLPAEMHVTGMHIAEMHIAQLHAELGPADLNQTISHVTRQA